ncbi:MAG: hypothetical protein HDT28_00260 [Clostridiales bacterium]|nr:hypothetical protein [Clostridiales bacterium]
MPNKIKTAVKAKKETVKAKAEAKKQDVKAKAAEIKQKSKKKLAKLAAARIGDKKLNTVSENCLELLVTIVNRSKGEFYLDLLQSFDVNMQFVTLGHGTADATMLSRFGFTDSDKTVIFSVIQQNKLPAALAALDERFRTIKNGKGVAYTIPMTSVIGKLIFGFLSNNKMTVNQQETKK